MNSGLSRIVFRLGKLNSTRLRGCFKSHPFSTNAAALQTQEKDPLHEGNNLLKTPSRGVLEIYGDDTVKFLQGMITNNMTRIASGGEGLFTAFLAPNGRVLYDAFVYPKPQGTDTSPMFLIECSAEATRDLMRHIKKYILRSKVKIQDVSEEYHVWSLWGPKSDLTENRVLEEVAKIRCKDTRYPGFGSRVLLPADKAFPVPPDFKELPSEEYTIRRILHGVPEGSDFFVGSSLPLESNFDYMNGIDFRKGCYVGQELTIRTHHTGVVRKRIVPVQITPEADLSTAPSSPDLAQIQVDRDVKLALAQPGQDVVIDGAKTSRNNGKFCGGIHNIGLALIRLETVRKPDIRFIMRASDDKLMNVRPTIPTWWPLD
ncbi:Aminomethyltransferase folate-binding domain-containing protein [Basidiobolus meristosporus CBS 931.73]|uniref:Aminomethyltransferase folate-binding domain-containing protein n=1 Tax=Basidiobolus meristosporus CBS 931.73 TaxID=1314790 RepID=A0A1Y1YCB8_9FUNG|nr:Aminomethyltransferase folate-binding domain-containing protein [Basidiobolus meristosporus CBS 931.73]|eukprot:ORX95627.1 Aminomethyltransferase folate-binding domain-containing protein [Basidiobolus meristosporus CBS 931.73]